MVLNTRSKKPYRVVVHTPTGRGAAYSDRYGELIIENASEALLAFARDRHVIKRAWNRAPRGVPSGLPLPAWLTDAMLDDCVLYWLWNDATPDAVVRTVPDA